MEEDIDDGIENDGGAGADEQPQKETSYAWIYYLVAVALTLIGLYQLSGYRKALAEQVRWNRASGMVTSHDVQYSGDSRSQHFSTFITYSYLAKGGEYSGGPVEVYPNRFFFSEDGAKDTLNKNYPRGGSLRVYYDPNNPGESSLGVAGSSGLAAPLALLILAGGIVFFGRQQ
jgi:hypothetical protein